MMKLQQGLFVLHLSFWKLSWRKCEWSLLMYLSMSTWDGEALTSWSSYPSEEARTTLETCVSKLDSNQLKSAKIQFFKAKTYLFEDFLLWQRFLWDIHPNIQRKCGRRGSCLQFFRSSITVKPTWRAMVLGKDRSKSDDFQIIWSYSENQDSTWKIKPYFQRTMVNSHIIGRCSFWRPDTHWDFLEPQHPMSRGAVQYQTQMNTVNCLYVSLWKHKQLLLGNFNQTGSWGLFIHEISWSSRHIAPKHHTSARQLR